MEDNRESKISELDKKKKEYLDYINIHEDRANYWIQVDPATVEQFIGLTDKYSKKIIFCLRGWEL